MSGILDALNPFKSVVDTISGLIGKFVADPRERAEAELTLYRAQTEFEAKLAEFDAEFAKAQRDVIIAEAQSGSWLTRNWRPLIMLFFCLVVGLAIFNSGHDLSGRTIPETYVNEAMAIIKLGVTGYIVGRSGEKIAKFWRGQGNKQ